MHRSCLIITIVFAFLFAYHYQKPILTTEEAIVQAYEYLLDPPKGYGDDMIPSKKLEEMWPISTRLTIKSGFFSEMMNCRVWEVTFRYEGKELSIIMDAITGEFITIYGPLN